MKKYLKPEAWSIIEDHFDPENQRSSESIFSLGNGRMGGRANFEERYSGPTLQGSYIAGIYYPDPTRVGWWKNGYPEYFAKILNSPNFIGIDVKIGSQYLDLYTAKVLSFRRELNMKEGTLTRTFTAEMSDGKRVEVQAQRFLSMVDTECACLRYSVKPLNFSGKITLTPYIDGNVVNQDSNYEKGFWEAVAMNVHAGDATLVMKTKKFKEFASDVSQLSFYVAYSMQLKLFVDGYDFEDKPELIKKEAWVGNRYAVEVKENQTVTLEKFVGVASSLNHPTEHLGVASEGGAKRSANKGYDDMLKEHKAVWANIWHHSDIMITGDVEAQQAIRFNIFQLNQTYTGQDARLNIGPKGFTGEKYGGTTYWDTEAYCIPFYISTARPDVTRQLLIYRHEHLQRAIENAQKLGFTGGAALYPMVTINGEECHNEWEITFEEIHRNGAIAFAIHNYIRHTQDYKYLEDFGLEVLLGISRFWAQRITYSEDKQAFVMLGVTGPNEYENNINNNWYTNKLAVWCLRYTMEALEIVKRNNERAYNRIVELTNFDEREMIRWKNIEENMYYPYSEKYNIFLQQDGYLDKLQLTVSDLDPSERPINQHWSWDRILRSCFIKQADTLQGIYLFENEFDTETIARHFDFYEPRCVHESSLSPCVHSVLASRLGRMDKAYELYLRTSRLDLDDYNNEVREGLHITSMAGGWMAVVEGFGGKRVYDGKLSLTPQIPQEWQEYTFCITFRGHDIEVRVNHEGCYVSQHGKGALELTIYGETVQINDNELKFFRAK